MQAVISTRNGQLVAEYHDFVVYLADAGIEGYGYGETVELPCEPQDMWELVDMLA